MAPAPAPKTCEVVGPKTQGLGEIYARYADFIWKSLYRMGVSDADRPDAMQEVLLVVHRRLETFDQSSKLSTWLFGICLRVASTMRRKRVRLRETPMANETATVALVEQDHPERLLLERDAQETFYRALNQLDPERRALLIMFEIEGIPCPKLAELLNVPVGTIHSRLYAARRIFQRALSRIDRDRSGPIQASGGSP